MTNWNNYNAIDLFKFICSLLVVSIHIPMFGGNTDFLQIASLGANRWLARIAVPFFFVSSGFFLFRKTSAEGFSWEPSKTFSRKILRLYILWTILYLPLIPDYLAGHENNLQPMILEFLRRFLLAGSFRHLWYLPTLFFSVIFLSYLLSKKVRLSTILAVASVLYLIGLTEQSWYGLFEPVRENGWAVVQFWERCMDFTVTTRNALFEGLLFVAIGSGIAEKETDVLPRKKAILGFIVSYLLMLAEVIVLIRTGQCKEFDMWLFLVPLVYFAFETARGIRLKDNPIYSLLRRLSTLIYLIHPFIIFALENILPKVAPNISGTCLPYILTVIFSGLVSLLIIHLAEGKVPMMKYLYM